MSWDSWFFGDQPDWIRLLIASAILLWLVGALLWMWWQRRYQGAPWTPASVVMDTVKGIFVFPYRLIYYLTINAYEWSKEPNNTMQKGLQEAVEAISSQ